MTRKDYELLAAVVNKEKNFFKTLYVEKGNTDSVLLAAGVVHLAKSIAEELALNNKSFDTKLFLTNCGVE